MPFQALTNAPMLREGVSLSFMAIPQIDGETPRPLTVGAEVTLRLGYCCPEIIQGKITASVCEATRIVLTTGMGDWVLCPGTAEEANLVPGIVSEVWCVV